MTSGEAAEPKSSSQCQRCSPGAGLAPPSFCLVAFYPNHRTVHCRLQLLGFYLPSPSRSPPSPAQPHSLEPSLGSDPSFITSSKGIRSALLCHMSWIRLKLQALTCNPSTQTGSRKKGPPKWSTGAENKAVCSQLPPSTEAKPTSHLGLLKRVGHPQETAPIPPPLWILLSPFYSKETAETMLWRKERGSHNGPLVSVWALV